MEAISHKKYNTTFFAIVATVIVIVDQITKHWAASSLNDGHVVHVIWTLQFSLAFNSGMAFSQGTNLGPFIGTLAMGATIALAFALGKSPSILSGVGMGLVLGGAIGNILDRLFRGQGWLRGSVVDFIDFQWFPVFNVADMGVTIGGALLVLGALIKKKALT
ncbi:MAG: signal peptidase II [Ilumatobacteraceae bacterium]|nr:signal peptidase II [Ilumatobacteraceae bacterium]